MTKSIELKKLNERVINLNSQVRRIWSLLFVVLVVVALFVAGSWAINKDGFIKVETKVSAINEEILSLQSNQQQIITAINDMINAIRYIAIETNVSAPQNATNSEY